MDWLAWFLSGVVIVYLSVYAYTNIASLYRFNRVKNRVLTIDGVIEGVIDESKKAFDGELVSIAYPLYKYVIQGEIRFLQGSVKYRNIVLGKNVELLFCEETGEIWAKNDLPLVKEQLMFRVGIVLIIILVMIVESLVL